MSNSPKYFLPSRLFPLAGKAPGLQELFRRIGKSLGKVRLWTELVFMPYSSLILISKNIAKFLLLIDFTLRGAHQNEVGPFTLDGTINGTHCVLLFVDLPLTVPDQ